MNSSGGTGEDSLRIALLSAVFLVALMFFLSTALGMGLGTSNYSDWALDSWDFTFVSLTAASGVSFLLAAFVSVIGRRRESRILMSAGLVLFVAVTVFAAIWMITQQHPYHLLAVRGI